MFPFKKILCPTDFDDPSRCALRMANEMALKFGSEIIVLHVHKPIPSLPTPRPGASEVTFDITAYQKEVEASALEQLQAFTAEELDPSLTPRLEVRLDRPAHGIIEFAEQEEPDAIFIATHGRTGIAHLVFGSVAERVVRQARCAVLSIRSCEAK
jgi:universal stress protein A